MITFNSFGLSQRQYLRPAKVNKLQLKTYKIPITNIQWEWNGCYLSNKMTGKVLIKQNDCTKVKHRCGGVILFVSIKVFAHNLFCDCLYRIVHVFTDLRLLVIGVYLWLYFIDNKANRTFLSVIFVSVIFTCICNKRFSSINIIYRLQIRILLPPVDPPSLQTYEADILRKSELKMDVLLYLQLFVFLMIHTYI